MTVGILHAAPRDAHWLTADIRVAPGNSGGPLCDVHGRLVGINTMVVDGLTLAISVRAIERFVRAAPRPGSTGRCCVIACVARTLLSAH